MRMAVVFSVLARLRRRSLLLGCACYAASNGLAHKNDWRYLAAAAAVAGVVSAGLRPVLLASFLLAWHSINAPAGAAGWPHWEHLAAIFSRAWRRNLRLTALIAQYAERIGRIEH